MRFASLLCTLLLPVCAVAQQLTESPSGPGSAKRVITFTTEADVQAIAAAKAVAEEARRDAFYRYPIGKTFWYKPSESRLQVTFFQHVGEDPVVPNIRHLQSTIRPDVTLSLQVLERFVLSETHSGQPISFAYRIVFEDGTEALVANEAFGKYASDRPIDGDRPGLAKDPAEAVSKLNDRLFVVDPERLAAQHAAEVERLKAEQSAAEATEAAAQAKARPKRTAAAKDPRRRSGVYLGMTAHQARASNWGAPQSVNRTTGSFGVHEQWVYGGGNYLYFQNGLLTSVQN